MTSLRKIKKDLAMVSTIGSIVNVYQKTAYLKMMKIRESVLMNREFTAEIAKVYHYVKESYLASLNKIYRKNKKNYFLKKKREKGLIFLSANQFFYGNLILDIWSQVYNLWKKEDLDLIIVGKIGRYLAKSYGMSKSSFYYFNLDDANPKKEEIGAIVDFIKDYEEVIVFHGRFRTILSQVVAKSSIKGNVSEKDLKIPEKIKKYLFEPSPEAVFEFFETEIMASLLHQAILEHSLAKYATRMVAMYKAGENAKKIKKEMEIIKKKLEWQEINKTQVEFFNAFSLWNSKK